MNENKRVSKGTVVIAIGGNAINKSTQAGTLPQQFENVNRICEDLVTLIEEGYRIVITHGNGPQVGILMVKNELARNIVPDYPLEMCGAQTEGSLGYIIEQCLMNHLRQRRTAAPVAVLLTQVLVRADDPAFQHPVKPIGSFYTEAESRELEQKYGFTMREDSGRGYRRIVPSPVPVDIVEKDAVRRLSGEGYVVICCGGGGIPVVEKQGMLSGVDAVIDKDRTSALLAELIGADCLMILTGVEQVSVNFGKPDERKLSCMTREEALKYLAEGQFPPGSMGPKIEAVCDYLGTAKPGSSAIITSLEKMADALAGKTGTRITV